ncbi:MAG: HIT domain-containing protein [Ignavibacteria bacterium]|jgi:diadenosine tetraphosphate (Ap4A) HIT family hydrolase|nr:HIT domain-containing protein [Ignavibacteria bacterium]
MYQDNCIFCKISKGEIPSYKIWEDDEFFAILDIFPNTKGMTLVIPKQHYDSYAFDMPDDVYTRFLLASKNIGKLLDEKLKVERTALVLEGMGVNHVHAKLYPLHGVGKDFTAMVPEGNVFYEIYQGYLSTRLGPKADDEEMKKIQALFK